MLNVFKHLLPRCRAWSLTIDKQLRQFFAGLAVIPDEIRTAANNAWLELFPDSVTTERLSDWEGQFNLRDTGLTEQERRDRLDATWKATGGQGLDYLQELFQSLGFDVYVHEFWDPTTTPPVNSEGSVTVRNPNTYLNDGTDPAPPLGYPLVSKGVTAVPQYTIQCGEALAQCGEPLAQCGQFTFVKGTSSDYSLPSDPEYWPYFVYVGGETFPNLASVPASRREEFEETLLKYCPEHLWIGVLCEYS